MPSWMSFMFQDSSSFSMVELSYLHDYIMSIMLLIIFLISYIMMMLFTMNFYYKFFSEGTLIEVIWSVVPAMLLLFLVSPSMKVLYIMEDIKHPLLTCKVVAHQWYWSYLVPFFNNLSYKFGQSFNSMFFFDSFMVSYNMDCIFPRLLSSSESLCLPVSVTSRLLVTSTDVIHSFSVPSLGLKVDAFPGRINQLYVTPSRLGIFFGQCSEICGSNHSFMPISVKICHLYDFLNIGKTYMLDSIFNDEDVLFVD